MTLKLDFECEACALRNQALYLAASAADALVAKGLKISEVASIARAEVRLQRMLRSAWLIRANQGVSGAMVAFNGNKGPEIITERALAPLGLWATDVERPYRDSVQEIHNLARIAGWKKATGMSKASLSYSERDLKLVSKASGKIIPDFSLVDKDVLRALEASQMVWIRNSYNLRLRTVILNAVRDSLAKGESRTAMGQSLKTALESILVHGSGAPHGYTGTYDQYFEVIAANVATTARNHAQIRSFSEIGVERYVIVNPMDHRTSEICIYMNGKEFTVSQGMSQIESELNARTPSALKAVHPWLSTKQFFELTDAKGQVSDEESASLANAGLAFPPYHAKCRSVADLIL